MSGLLATSSHASIGGLSQWFQSPTGRRLLDEQIAPVSGSARRFHGDTLLWVGCQTPLMDTVRGCMIRHHFHLEVPGASAQVLDENDPSQQPLAAFQADLTEIPLHNNALDALVLHHALESASDPRTAIRECARVVAGGGRLVVCAFNPLSLWGLRGAYGRAFEDSFSRLHFISPLRLVDWLTVLGFETEPASYIAYNLPFGKGGSDARLWRGTRNLLARYQLPIGGAYVLSAVKRAVAARPDRTPARLQAGKLAGVAYPKLNAWNRIERTG